MTGKPLLIFGLGELPDQAQYYFSQHAGRQVAAFTVDAEYASVGQFAKSAAYRAVNMKVVNK